MSTTSKSYPLSILYGTRAPSRCRLLQVPQMPMTIAGGRDQPDLPIDELLRLLRYEKGRGDTHKISPIGSMVLLYMVTWIPSIYPSHVSIYTSTMDPMGHGLFDKSSRTPSQNGGYN